MNRTWPRPLGQCSSGMRDRKFNRSQLAGGCSKRPRWSTARSMSGADSNPRSTMSRPGFVRRDDSLADPAHRRGQSAWPTGRDPPAPSPVAIHRLGNGWRNRCRRGSSPRDARGVWRPARAAGGRFEDLTRWMPWARCGLDQTHRVGPSLPQDVALVAAPGRTRTRAEA
jgi:hypothetical protein